VQFISLLLGDKFGSRIIAVIVVASYDPKRTAKGIAAGVGGRNSGPLRVCFYRDRFR